MTPIPHDLLVLMLEHLRTERARESDPPATANRLAELLAIRKDLLLEEGVLLAWTGETGKVWGGLRVTSTAGVFCIDPRGELVSEKALAQDAFDKTHQGGHGTVIVPSLDALAREGFSSHALGQAYEATSGLVQKQGLGLHFSIDQDKRESLDAMALSEALLPFNCHANVGLAIGASLKKDGARSTTTRYPLLMHFEGIANALKPFGITLQRTWPRTAPVNATQTTVLDEQALRQSVSALQGQFSRQ
jgi:hypothetical protein